MSAPLNIKSERALTSYIREQLADFTINIYGGHEKNDAVIHPYVICSGINSAKHAEMPSETGVRNVTLDVQISADSEVAGSRDLIDSVREKLECALEDVEGIKQHINVKGYGYDTREIKDIHFYDIMNNQETEDTEFTDWIESMQLVMTCQAHDELK